MYRSDDGATATVVSVRTHRRRRDGLTGKGSAIADIHLDHITKFAGENEPTVKDVRLDIEERRFHDAERHSRDGSGVTPRLGRQLDDVGGLGDHRLVGVITQDVVLDLVVNGEAQLAVRALVWGRVHGSSALQLALGSSGPSPRERVDLPQPLADRRRASGRAGTADSCGEPSLSR